MRQSAYLAFFFIAAIAASIAGATTVLLEYPSNDFTAFEPVQKFVFIAEGLRPISCKLLVDGAAVASANASVGSTDVSTSLASGLREWRVACVDAKGEKAESESRSIIVSSSSDASVSALSVGTADFSIASGAVVASSTGLIKEWEAAPSRAVSFSASVSNNGVSSITALLTVKIRDSENNLVTSVQSSPYSLSPGETRLLKAAWTPENAGEYYAEGIVSDRGSNNVMQKSFLKLSVSGGSEANFVALSMIALCVTAVILTSYSTRKNISEIKEIK